MFCETLIGKRHVKVTEQWTRKESTVVMRELSDVFSPEVDKIISVMDNLNIYSPASFYQTITPEEGR